MSIEGLTAFFARLQEDSALQQQAFSLEDAGAAERVEGLCRLAKEHGFDVAPEDWAHEQAGSAAAALDDESLRKVTGGTICFSPGLFGGQHEGGPIQGL